MDDITALIISEARREIISRSNLPPDLLTTIESAIGKTIVRGYRPGDSPVRSAAHHAAQHWIDTFVGHALAAYVDRIESARCNADLASVGECFSAMRIQLGELVPKWQHAIDEKASRATSHFRQASSLLRLDGMLQKALKKIEPAMLKIESRARLAQQSSKTASVGPNIAVFHGRDPLSKSYVEKFLKRHGLNPVSFPDVKANRKPEFSPDYVHQIVEDFFKQCSAAVVICCPEETATLRLEFTTDGEEKAVVERLQPRPNVLYELGLAIGRFESKVVVVQFGSFEWPSDLDGLHAYRYEPGCWENIHGRLSQLGLPLSPYDSTLRFRQWSLPNQKRQLKVVTPARDVRNRLDAFVRSLDQEAHVQANQALCKAREEQRRLLTTARSEHPGAPVLAEHVYGSALRQLYEDRAAEIFGAAERVGLNYQEDAFFLMELLERDPFGSFIQSTARALSDSAQSEGIELSMGTSLLAITNAHAEMKNMLPSAWAERIRHLARQANLEL